MKTIIVTGGRDYSDRETVELVLFSLDIEHLVEGGALGADRLCREVAQERNVCVTTFYADWDTHGKAAGPMRNLKMLKTYPNAIVLAFPGGKGTENCIKQAKELGMLVLRVEK